MPNTVTQKKKQCGKNAKGRRGGAIPSDEFSRPLINDAGDVSVFKNNVCLQSSVVRRRHNEQENDCNSTS